MVRQYRCCTTFEMTYIQAQVLYHAMFAHCNSHIFASTRCRIQMCSASNVANDSSLAAFPLHVRRVRVWVHVCMSIRVHVYSS